MLTQSLRYVGCCCKSLRFRKVNRILNRTIFHVSRNCSSPWLNSAAAFCSQASLDIKVQLKNEHLAQYVDKIMKEYNNYLTEGQTALKTVTSVAVVRNVVDIVNTLQELEKNIALLREMKSDAGNDQEFLKSLEEELDSSEKDLVDFEEKLLDALVSSDDDNLYSDIIIEVNGGVGGQEAMLFAKELFDLYCNYLEFCGWDYEFNECDSTDIGGLRKASILASGQGSFKWLQFEGGVHRVQRIPKTEGQGRMHTSTVSVAVYPQPSEVDIALNDADLKYEAKTSSGPGGQHVNRIKTAVRLYHLPSGIVVECQVSRSHTQNRKLALQKLRLKLFQIESEKLNSTILSTRKAQIKTKSRNEKVRTYNYSQDRVTDHRFRKSLHGIPRYMEGREYYHNFLREIMEEYDRRKKQDFLTFLKTVR